MKVQNMGLFDYRLLVLHVLLELSETNKHRIIQIYVIKDTGLLICLVHIMNNAKCFDFMPQIEV